MNEKDFVRLCKQIVAKYTNEHLDKSDNKQITENDVFIVWQCKTLQNNKALVSTTLFDGMYYELTYNGDKREIYLDAYKKFENKCIDLNCCDCAHAQKTEDILTLECDAEVYDIDTPSCFVLREEKPL